MSIVGIIEAAIGFGLLIFVHELGHFLAAKWTKVRVETFSLGFGPALLKKKWGATTYQLSIVPFGGYVKMAGEDAELGKPAEPDHFNAKTVGQRSLIFVAGVTMNIIFGFLVFMLAYGTVGVPTVPATVGEVVPGSPAWMAGIETGDRITGINHVSPPIDYEDLKVSVTLAGRDKALHLTLQRGNETLQKDVTPEYQKEMGMKGIGIGMPFSMALADPARIPPSTDKELDYRLPYQKGAAAGDVIVAVKTEGGELTPVETPTEMERVVDQAGGKPVELTLMPANGGAEKKITLNMVPTGKPVWLGIQFGSNTVKAVHPNTWAERAGLRQGDRITQVGDKVVRAPSEIEAALSALPRQQVSLTVLREADGRQGSVTLDAPAIRPAGLSHAVAFEPNLTVDRLWKDYPAARAGLQAGDVVLSLNGNPVKDHVQFSDMLESSGGKPLTLKWQRNGTEMTAAVVQQKRWDLPLAFQSVQHTMRAGVFKSVLLGGRKAFQWVVRIYATLRSLVEGEIAIRHLSGPVSIGYFTYVAAKEGVGVLLYLLGVLSVNLGVFNLLPIPVLDGGHLMFAVIEKLRGKPVSEKVRAIANYTGLVFILGIAVLALWNDFQNLIFSRF